jgi:hypothetical protein
MRPSARNGLVQVSLLPDQQTVRCTRVLDRRVLWTRNVVEERLSALRQTCRIRFPDRVRDQGADKIAQDFLGPPQVYEVSFARDQVLIRYGRASWSVLDLDTGKEVSFGSD